MGEKFKAFGWAVKEVDGHDVMALKETFESAPFTKGKPNLVIANTIKGKGISYMEGVLKWHHGVPSDDEFEMAIGELEKLEKELVGG